MFQQPVGGVEVRPVPLELGHPVAEGPVDLGPGEQVGLVEQRHTAELAAQLVVLAQEGLPALVAGGDRVEGDHRAVVAVGEQRAAVGEDPVADGQQVDPVAGALVVLAGELEVAAQTVQVAVLGERPDADPLTEQSLYETLRNPGRFKLKRPGFGSNAINFGAGV